MPTTTRGKVPSPRYHLAGRADPLELGVARSPDDRQRTHQPARVAGRAYPDRGPGQTPGGVGGKLAQRQRRLEPADPTGVRPGPARGGNRLVVNMGAGRLLKTAQMRAATEDPTEADAAYAQERAAAANERRGLFSAAC